MRPLLAVSAAVASAIALGLASPSPAAAQSSVALSGRIGAQKALLVIDGAPQAVAVGGTVRGVRLVSLGADDAVVEFGGKRTRLALGSAPVTTAGTSSEGSGDGRIVIPVGSGGHFVALGSINGKTVQFMVDTGATSIALSQAEAERIGLPYKGGRLVRGHSANGELMMHLVRLSTVRIGDVQVREVEAVVVPSPMPHVLLGNSFLSRFSMKRDSDVLTLVLRP